jgi:GH43 family beta-xylosidase
MIPRSIQNPAYAAYFADPFVWFHDGVYYAVGTGRDEADACPRTGNVVPMVKSTDLQNWTSVGHVLQQPPEEKGGCFWAPEVFHDGKLFHMYYHPNGQGKGFHIRCATSENPEGPYRDVGRPLTDLTQNPFAIDAHCFKDDDGTGGEQWYMYYATDFLDYDATTFRGTALVVDRMTSMTSLEGNPKLVMRSHHPWQIFKKDRDMYGKIADWYTLEGATVIKRHGKYFLFYSGGCYENDSYGVDYLVADHPLGPWKEVGGGGGAKGPQVIRTIPGKVIGPGHNSIITTPDGDDYIIYHAWNHEMTERQLWVDRLDWKNGKPTVERFAGWIEQCNRNHK